MAAEKEMYMKIQSTATIGQSKIKCLVYGDSGIGKTTLASTLGGKTLIISSEAGLLSLSNSSIDFVDINVDDEGNSLSSKGKIDKLGKLCKMLSEDKGFRDGYNNIFIDSISDISSFFEDYFDQINKDEKNRFQKWGDYSRSFGRFIKGFRDLIHYNVIFVALRSQDKDESSDTFGSWQPSVIGKTSKDIVEANLDEIFMYSFDKEGNRKLITGKTNRNSGKDRSGKLDLVEEPNLQLIFNKIRGEKKK